jgi:uncharacterized Zn finger protein
LKTTNRALPCAPDTIVCPFCSHPHEDVFEVLEVNTLHDDFHCTGCGKPFAAYITECARCAAEQAFAWKTVPSAIELAALMCQACGHSNADNARHADSQYDASF